MDLNECLNSNIWLASCNQKKYGCHRPRVPHREFCNDLTERICVYCNRKRPVSLEELSILVLLRNVELLKTADFAQSHHPQRIYWIIGRAINSNLYCEVSDLAQFISKDVEPSLALFDVEPGKEVVLKRFLFYCSVYNKLKGHMENPSSLIDGILGYLEDFDNDYNDFWQVMTSVMQSIEINDRDTLRRSGLRYLVNSVVKKILPWIDNEILYLGLTKPVRPTSGFRSIITSVAKIFIPWLDSEILNVALSRKTWPTADRRESVDVYVNIPELMKGFYKPGINCGGRDYEAMRELQQMQKRADVYPVVLKTRAIANPNFLPQDASSLLHNVDPQSISYVAITASSPWTVENIDELGRVLSTCKNLSFIYLRQVASTETAENMASAVSRVLCHHPHLQMIGLSGFPLGEMMERYPLPPVAELRLFECGLTDADWKFMASRTDLALRELAVSCTLPLPPSPNLFEFILSQGTTLESLSLYYQALMPNQVCDLMTSMVKFGTLHHLHVSYSHLDLVSMLNILLAFIPIASAEKLQFETPDEMPEVDMLINYLLTQMKTYCVQNRRLPVCLSLIDHPTQLEEKEVITVWHN